MTVAYRRAGYQRPAMPTKAPQPIDWTKRLATQITRKAARLAESPNATTHAADRNIPSRKMRRPPARSAKSPLTTLPSAYAINPAELSSPSSFLPMSGNSCTISGAATERFERQT